MLALPFSRQPAPPGYRNRLPFEIVQIFEKYRFFGVASGSTSTRCTSSTGRNSSIDPIIEAFQPRSCLTGGDATACDDNGPAVSDITDNEAIYPP